MLPAQGQRELEDLAMQLAQQGSALASTLHPVVRQSVGDLVRTMNCYYSNLIEGSPTRPRDIERALQEDFDTTPEKRNLQLEAKAHIAVQAMIDAREAPPVRPTREFLCWAHREFCSRLPDPMLWVENPDTGKKLKVIPGALRQDEVTVGRHIPPLSSNLEAFMGRFEDAYDPVRLSKVQQVIAIAAAHHRLVWIHPFLDGNGRVARLFSHAWLLDTGIGSGLWSVSRGLARSVENYKVRLAAADAPRQGDLDGRGNLSEKALVDFCRYFLETAIGQIDFMRELLDTRNLLTRMQLHIEEEIALDRLPRGAFALMREAVMAGEFRRGEAPGITGYQERAARDVLGALLDKRYLKSDSPKGPVRLGFPLEAVERWLPRLYPVD